MAGWNFYLYEALLIPFEITALYVVLGFWRDDIPVAAVCAACVVLYGFVPLPNINRARDLSLMRQYTDFCCL